ncbi:hypothetical protein Tco_0820609 [Tanacetum coccineum]|uniref:Uncharacterized protein n=1 Tax=Tanacetum coccineum TaxID=301880 RepID=A0ABQ5A9X5_9ASTR
MRVPSLPSVVSNEVFVFLVFLSFGFDAQETIRVNHWLLMPNVGENCIGDAGNGRPQGDARMEDAEVEEGKPDKTQGTDDQDDVKGNNSSDAASNKEAQSMTSSDDLIIIV